jgi:hydroxyacylglutathione hydrolase
MKRIVNYTLVTLAALVAAMTVFAGIYYYRFRSEVKIMTPLESGRVVTGITAIKTEFVNFFIIENEAGALAIDTGADLNQAQAEMDKLKIDPSAVRAVFLTHTDGDHTAAARLFSKATVYIARQEEPLVTGAIHKVPFVKNKIGAPYQLLSDGQVIVIGAASIKGILVPGHSPGSMCYLVNHQFLFTGDTLSLNNGVVEPFNDFFNMDTKEQIVSIRKLSRLKNISYLLTAHYGMSSDVQAAFRNWR